MSDVLRPYLLDLQTLRKACGSNDATLVDAIIASQSAFIADYEKQGQLSPGATLHWLTKLIKGEAVKESSGWAYLYGYCLELLCRHFGKHHPLSLFEDFHSSYLTLVRDLNTDVTKKKKKPDPKKLASLKITVNEGIITVNCENISFNQFQTCLNIVARQWVNVIHDAEWAISGDFSGTDYLTLMQNCLAPLGLEPLLKQTNAGNTLLIRSLEKTANRSGYRLKGLDFEVCRYPAPIGQYNDYPWISYLAREEYDQDLTALKNKEFASKDGEINAGRKQYAGLLKKAAKANLDIVFFV